MIHSLLYLLFVLLLIGSGVYWGAQRLYPALIERRERKRQLESDPATNFSHPQRALYEMFEQASKRVEVLQSLIAKQREEMMQWRQKHQKELAELKHPKSYEEHLLKLDSVASVEHIGDNVYKITENEFIPVCTADQSEIVHLWVPTQQRRV